MNNIFIPKKIRVGYQDREDTYTGKLAYVIYYDEKDKIKKEASFKGWVQGDVDEKENEPMTGYILNKGVQRYGHFNSSSAKLRIYDPRGFEFEISMSNFIEITKYSNILKQEIEQECVLGWEAGELVLIPTNSELYKQAQEYSNSLFKLKIEKINLEVGKSYKTKTKNNLLYLGKFTVNHIKTTYEGYGYPRSELRNFENDVKKQDVFFNLDCRMFDFSNKSTIIGIDNDIEHNETNDLLQYFHHFNGLNKVTNFSIVPVTDPKFEKQKNTLIESYKKNKDEKEIYNYYKEDKCGKYIFLKGTNRKIDIDYYNNINISQYEYDSSSVKSYAIVDSDIQLKWNKNFYNSYGGTKKNNSYVEIDRDKFILDLLNNIELKTFSSGNIFNGVQVIYDKYYYVRDEMFEKPVPKLPYSIDNMLKIDGLMKA